MIKKYQFEVSTRYVGSGVKETIEIELDNDLTEEEIENEVQEYYEEWLMENSEQIWHEVE